MIDSTPSSLAPASLMRFAGVRASHWTGFPPRVDHSGSPDVECNKIIESGISDNFHMNIEADGPVENAGEREVDLTVVQLLESSADFREWVVGRVAPQLTIDEYLGGIIHVSYAGAGESDIEFGVRTATGDRHLVLIENKIDAAKQPDQVERYYKRGRFRVDHQDWDSFTVCLLAPDRYVSPDGEEGFDSIVRYEAVRDHLEDLTHDSAAFARAVFESALQRSTTVDASDELGSIAQQFRSRTELPDLQQSVSLNKRVAFQSAHPQHPAAVQYDVYIGETGADGRSSVRLQIASEEGVTDAERDAIKSTVSQHRDSLPDYELNPDRKKNIFTTTVWHEEAVQDQQGGSPVDAIVNELLALTETFHPIFVRNPVR